MVGFIDKTKSSLLLPPPADNALIPGVATGKG